MVDSRVSVARAWDRIEQWIEDNDTQRLITLPRGVTKTQLKYVLAILDCELPLDVREWYLRHDGTGGFWLFDQGFVLPLIGPATGKRRPCVTDLWRMWRQVGERIDGERPLVQGPIRSEWWRDRWVPVTENWEGESLCLDLDPSEGGTVGQVFFCRYRGTKRAVIAASWEELLSKRADDLESGRYAMTDDGRIGRVARRKRRK